MKKTLNSLLLSLFLLCCMAIAQSGLAQAPPPPPSGDKGSASNKGPGGGAPIDAGLVLTLAMVAGFGSWKLLNAKRRKNTI
jgi:hypothetical protein